MAIVNLSGTLFISVPKHLFSSPIVTLHPRAKSFLLSPYFHSSFFFVCMACDVETRIIGEVHVHVMNMLNLQGFTYLSGSRLSPSNLVEKYCEQCKGSLFFL